MNRTCQKSGTYTSEAEFAIEAQLLEPLHPTVTAPCNADRHVSYSGIQRHFCGMSVLRKRQFVGSVGPGIYVDLMQHGERFVNPRESHDATLLMTIEECKYRKVSAEPLVSQIIP